MGDREQKSIWQRWLRQPQRIWLRRALFQVHLWSGIAIGLYIVFISVTGSVLVYSNEMYRAATPAPIISTSTAPRLTDDQLKAKALHLYPEYVIANLQRAHNPEEAVAIRLRRGEATMNRLFDPRTGVDLGDAVSTGIRFVSKLIDLHDNLFAGMRGRAINGIGAFLTLVLAVTGMVVWWPGVTAWKRSLTVPRDLGWKRLIWQLHSVIGFWTLAFVLIFALSGIYLAIPDRIQERRRLARSHGPSQHPHARQRPDHLLARVPALRSYQRDRDSVPRTRRVRSGDQGGLGLLRTRARRHVRDRRHHVVEPRAAPAVEVDADRSETMGVAGGYCKG